MAGEGNPNWIKGAPSANPNGRPSGSRNRRTAEIIEQLIATGNKDPLLTLSEIQQSNEDAAVRATAANMLAPYLHSKMAAVPAPRFVDHPLEMPELNTIPDAEEFLAKIPLLVTKGELDFQSALELSTLTKNWIEAKYHRDELQLKMAIHDQTTGPQVIRIEGGLSQLPGTNIRMPDLNARNGHELPAPTTMIDHTPATHEAQSQDPELSSPTDPPAGS
jgi:hypothetical protein